MFMTFGGCLQLLAAAKNVVKAKTAGPAEKGAAVAKKGHTAKSSAKVDYGAEVLDALRNMNSKSSTQALTNVKAPGTINPVLPHPPLPSTLPILACRRLTYSCGGAHADCSCHREVGIATHGRAAPSPSGCATSIINDSSAWALW
jgi:hypothetical protein